MMITPETRVFVIDNGDYPRWRINEFDLKTAAQYHAGDLSNIEHDSQDPVDRLIHALRYWGRFTFVRPTGYKLLIVTLGARLENPLGS